MKQPACRHPLILPVFAPPNVRVFFFSRTFFLFVRVYFEPHLGRTPACVDGARGTESASRGDHQVDCSAGTMSCDGGGARATVEVLLHFHGFKNLDLRSRG